MEQQLASKRFANECTLSYVSTIREFISDHIAGRLAQLRKSRGMYDALEREDEWDTDTDLSMGASGTENNMISQQEFC